MVYLMKTEIQDIERMANDSEELVQDMTINESLRTSWSLVTWYVNKQSNLIPVFFFSLFFLGDFSFNFHVRYVRFKF